MSANGKTSVWLFSSTRKELSAYRQGGESWDAFLNRICKVVKKLPDRKRRSDVPESVPVEERRTIWINTETREGINALRRGDESWDGFFRRLTAILLENDLPRNPN